MFLIYNLVETKHLVYSLFNNMDFLFVTYFLSNKERNKKKRRGEKYSEIQQRKKVKTHNIYI